jgi:hypothetical protein
MSFEVMSRLLPFEGLCLTADDLAAEQGYHRRSLHRHAHYLHGWGIVQGLQVELQQSRRDYSAIIKAGYGLCATGQGVHLPQDVVVPLPVPEQDGEYVLWLFHVEQPDQGAARTVYDTAEQREARVLELAASRLHPADEDHEDAVALCRIVAGRGRLTQLQLPVPRAGRQGRAAESYLKPRVVEFVRLNRTILTALYRTAIVKELSLAALGFSSALVSAEFLLIEEGTGDRVLYRAAGNLVGYAHDFYLPLPPTTERIEQLKEFLRRLHAEVPAPDHGDAAWLAWFQSFERLLQPLLRIVEELGRTSEAMR